MQGVFDHPQVALAANWGESLDPDVDDPTQRDYRENQQVHAFSERLRQDQPVPAPGDPAAPPLDPIPPVKIPIAPPARFVVKDMPFYIMKGPADEWVNMAPRPGQWGKYTVAYSVDAAAKTAMPYAQRDPNTIALVLQPGDPGVSEDKSDTQPTPDTMHCQRGRDFIACTDTKNPKFWEVGLAHARQILEKAEASDLEFARRMEGLGSVSQSVVWNCLDPDYDASDREAVMSQFMQKYLERFYARVEPSNVPDIESVAAEALHKHKVFCQTWVQKHYRTLTPVVTAPAEALAAEFYSHVERFMDPLRKLTRMELARILMRHPMFSTDFATALYYYSGTLEQSRGGRNATYKQMSQTNSAKINSYRRLSTLLDDKWVELSKVISEITKDASAYYMHTLTVDWYDILGQTPPMHRYFDEHHSSSFLHSTGKRPGGGNQNEPPWRRHRH
jgi:hypothetical protein